MSGQALGEFRSSTGNSTSQLPTGYAPPYDGKETRDEYLGSQEVMIAVVMARKSRKWQM